MGAAPFEYDGGLYVTAQDWCERLRSLWGSRKYRDWRRGRRSTDTPERIDAQCRAIFTQEVVRMERLRERYKLLAREQENAKVLREVNTSMIHDGYLPADDLVQLKDENQRLSVTLDILASDIFDTQNSLLNIGPNALPGG